MAKFYQMENELREKGIVEEDVRNDASNTGMYIHLSNNNYIQIFTGLESSNFGIYIFSIIEDNRFDKYINYDISYNELMIKISEYIRMYNN